MDRLRTTSCGHRAVSAVGADRARRRGTRSIRGKIMSIDVAARSVAGDERDYYEAYRVLSSSAVASCVLGVLSAATLLSYEYGVALGIVPILAILLAARALWVIYHNPEEFTGKRLAIAGLAMASVFLVAGMGMAGVVYATEVPEGY